MAIIIRQSLDYLVERGELSVNHYNEFKANPKRTAPLAVILNFSLALMVGELLSL